ncbi:hypothetical protein BDZ91DRAFT_725241 [Kalaharituber pfeilii]|nr:hypothetical protein BDZ91DRAFT_725241 [Kalaharituber pfeilii]
MYHFACSSKPHHSIASHHDIDIASRRGGEASGPGSSGQARQRAQNAGGAGKGKRQQNTSGKSAESGQWKLWWLGGKEAVIEPLKAKEDSRDPLVVLLEWAGR